MRDWYIFVRKATGVFREKESQMLNLKPITVIFAGDDAIVREAFVAMCSAAAKLKVVGDFRKRPCTRGEALLM